MLDHHDKFNEKSLKDESNTPNCFVENHIIGSTNSPVLVLVPEGTSHQPVFQDFTGSHNKTLLQLSSTSLKGKDPVPLAITIISKSPRNPITAIITESTRIFQVENFESLSVSNVASTPGGLNVFIQKTFCIYCEE
ncbi:exosporium protein D [Bacillus sp. S10(2024)]|uniref:exosporium protein D n=1 Tax=Bacillus sp. S10(2024) TaxID=3162886 RepID=UPI003D24A309